MTVDPSNFNLDYINPYPAAFSVCLFLPSDALVALFHLLALSDSQSYLSFSNTC